MVLSSNDILNELEKIKVHDHCCMIYESEDEWKNVVMLFIMQGLLKGEKCVYVVNKRNEDYISESLQAYGIDVSGNIGSKQLEFIKTEDLIGKCNCDDINQMVNLYSEYLEDYLAEGYSTVRVTTEALFRYLSLKPVSKFLELQLMLNRDLFPHYPLISLCQYHRQEDHPMVLRDAVISSKWLWKGYHVHPNLSSISPEFYFQNKKYAWEAEHWLRTQELLMESEEKYRLIVERSLDMITILDADTYKILFVSPSNFRMMGYSPEEVIGKCCVELIHPQYQEEVLNAFRVGKLHGEGEGIALIQTKSGDCRWIESKGTLIHKDGANDTIIIISRDIHEKKLAEQALLESQQNYKNQLNYLNTLINTMNELCLTYDRESKLTFVNNRMIETLGYDSEELVGKSILDFLPDEFQEYTQVQVNKRLFMGEISSYENTLIHKDGSIVLVKLKGSPIIENDEIVGGLVLAEDITQQKKIEREMARLGQLNTVGEIAASIGHEIRNPMTTVQGFLQIMSHNEDFKDHQDHFDLMLEELDRANSIITEFLALAKDKLVNLQRYNINKIIETLAPLMVADATNGDKNIKLELGDVPELLLDEKEVRQLVLNLVRNGLEAMQQGGTVTIRTSRNGDGAVLLEVEDEGEGIPAEIVDKLGTPFVSTKEKGTGLGLAVCYSIVARHNAAISVESKSSGSTFKIHFPCL